MVTISPHRWVSAVLICLGPALLAHAQADPTAIRKFDLSMFTGSTAVYTGLSQGRDAAVTAGLDLNLPQVWLVRPALEGRFSTPFDRGSVDRQKEVLGGLRVEFPAARLHPYVDFLAGSGQIHFNGAYTTYAGTSLYAQPSSTVLSPGAGISFDLGAHLSVFADAQLQRWSTPASLSGHLFSKPLTCGISYRLALPHRHHVSPE